MKRSISACLWFDDQARPVAEFHCSLFPKSRILENTSVVTTYDINGMSFMALNGGPKYQVNPAVSYFVYCGSEEEIDRIYETISKDGEVLMPLDRYDWSPKYAWVQDAFGVNWQLDMEDIRSTQKIVPALLFANEKHHLVKEAMKHYTKVFPDSKVLIEAPYPANANLPEGTLLFAQFRLDKTIFNAMSSTLQHDFDFSHANAFVVACDTQEEIDHFWEQLGDGGRYLMCGWLEDKFGVSWQIKPAILSDLVDDPEKGPKVIEAFLKMQKFDIAALLAV